MKKVLALLAFSGMLLVSCSDDDAVIPMGPSTPTPEIFTAGSADFSNYVALGNSLTAGYSDSALFADGQNASYPNMMATSFMAAGGGSFTIPLMADNLGGLTLGGQPLEGFGNRLILSFASGSPAPVAKGGSGSTEVSTILSGSFNNMGVPGAKSFHLSAPGYGNVQGLAVGAANPYYVRFASSPDASVIGDAIAQGPSFFTLWIGNNDILSYATSGGAGVDQEGNLDPTTYGSNDITDPMVFGSVYDGLLQGLTASATGGVVANLPDVTTIPYFTTVPHNPVPLDAATAALLNSSYAAYNGGLGQLQLAGLISEEELAQRTITFTAGEANAVVLLDEDLTDVTAINPALLNMRQATADDLLVLPSQNIIGSLADPANPTSINGVAIPLADQWVLTPEEQTAVITATAKFNATIEALATQYDLGFVDANAFLKVIGESGIQLSDGSTVTATYGTGGGFSLDGVHPSPRGYSLLANEFLKVIEAKYGANLPQVEPLDYTGLYLD